MHGTIAVSRDVKIRIKFHSFFKRLQRLCLAKRFEWIYETGGTYLIVWVSLIIEESYFKRI